MSALPDHAEAVLDQMAADVLRGLWPDLPPAEIASAVSAMLGQQDAATPARGRLHDGRRLCVTDGREAALQAALEALETAGEALATSAAALRLALASEAAGEAEELLPLAAAAQRVGRSKDCLRRWAVQHGLGRKEAGRWYVSSDRLRAFLAT